MTKVAFSPTTWLVVGILLIAAYLRLWNLPHSLQFLGDQGRDAIIVSKIFKEADLVFIGPVTSVGNMYLGPLYYYFMAPFLWLSYPSPLGPVYAVAGLSLLTTWLIYLLGQELVGKKAALIATFFFATSAVVVEFARFSWNPNPAPLFSLLMIYSTYQAWQGKLWYWLGVAVAFSILIQLHYLTLLALPAAGLIWLVQLVTLVKGKSPALSQFAAVTVISLVLFLMSLAPLMAFDYKHGWLNAKAFGSLLSSEENFGGTKADLVTKITKPLKETHGRSLHILFEITLGQARQLNTLLVIGSLSLLAYLLSKMDQRPTFKGEAVLATYLFFGIVGTSFYEHTVFNHYIAYLFPVTFLIYGLIGAWLWQKHVLGKLALVAFAAYFLVFNYSRYPIKTIGWTIDDIKRTSQSIAERVKPGEIYNIVLLSETKDLYGQNYRYYLSTTSTPPIIADPALTSEAQHPDAIETLFIINEERKTTQVTALPIYEITIFPDKEPVEVYTIPGGPEITVLRRK